MSGTRFDPALVDAFMRMSTEEIARHSVSDSRTDEA
jgi:hypothetical protein